ncbi:MAG: transposase domain-containing protein [Rhizobiales bacterium]|nr:transposase domain-containing protein [Hyphomicrobiales bacterium]
MRIGLIGLDRHFFEMIVDYLANVLARIVNGHPNRQIDRSEAGKL